MSKIKTILLQLSFWIFVFISIGILCFTIYRFIKFSSISEPISGNKLEIPNVAYKDVSFMVEEVPKLKDIVHNCKENDGIISYEEYHIILKEYYFAKMLKEEKSKHKMTKKNEKDEK